MIRWILFAIVMFATPAQAAWKHVDLAADVSLRAVAVTDAARFHVSGSKGTHAVTDDGGKTWRQAAPPGTETLDFRGVAALDAKTAVLMSAGDSIVLMEVFDMRAPPNAGTPRLLEGVGRLDAKTLIAVGPRGTALSTDEGQSWRQVDEEAFHAISCRAGTCVAAGAKGKVAVWTS